MLPITVPQHVFYAIQEQIANRYYNWNNFIEEFIDDDFDPVPLSDLFNKNWTGYSFDCSRRKY